MPPVNLRRQVLDPHHRPVDDGHARRPPQQKTPPGPSPLSRVSNAPEGLPSREASTAPMLRRSKASVYEWTGNPTDEAPGVLRRKPKVHFAEGSAATDGPGKASKVREAADDSEQINRHAQRLLQIHGRSIAPDVVENIRSGIYYESKEVPPKRRLQTQGDWDRSRKEANQRLGEAVLQSYRRMVVEGHVPFKARKQFVQLSER
ncbi:hypothetical protein [Paracidovorax konjaci]|uniref:Uncharacterized protein n=1 Tax=Paracidovorax konjaci TaxID=32040 RepID=A0A1I1Y6A2_9BURK|nr:hypothetical protein [Paracidovorax konjaci]SFE15076.1 hypothetical protein SAMN04489710_11612 [Paracidovorax konjaci]